MIWMIRLTVGELSWFCARSARDHERASHGVFFHARARSWSRALRARGTRGAPGPSTESSKSSKSSKQSSYLHSKPKVMHAGKLMCVFSARDYEGHLNDGAILAIEADATDQWLFIRTLEVRSLKKRRSTTTCQDVYASEWRNLWT